MNQWLVMLLVFVTSTSIGACIEQEAGDAKFDLGDGYEATFVLPDIGNPYVLDYLYADGIAESILSKAYGFTISSDGKDLASVRMYVFSDPQFQYIPPAGTEASSSPDEIGPRIIVNKTISGSPGYVGYDLQVGATEMDTTNPMGGFFKCFPGAFKEANDLKGLIEVYGESSGLSSSAQSLQVFNSLVDSIKITGPGI